MVFAMKAALIHVPPEDKMMRMTAVLVTGLLLLSSDPSHSQINRELCSAELLHQKDDDLPDLIVIQTGEELPDAISRAYDCDIPTKGGLVENYPKDVFVMLNPTETMSDLALKK